MKLLLTMLLSSLLPAVAFAQAPGRVHAEASAGVYLPDIGGWGNQKTGWTAGGRIAMERRNTVQLFAHYSWAQADETGRTGSISDFVLTGVRQHLIAVGADLGLGGPVRIELALGAVGQLSRVDRIEGSPDPSFYPDGRGGQQSDWSWSAAAVPAISYRIIDRVVIRARDLMILDDVLGRHNVAFTVGIIAF